MNKRFYEVQPEECAVDVSNVSQIPNALAKFIIDPNHHFNNNQWNGVRTLDLEGYVLVKENDQLLIYNIIGIEEDSKVMLDYKYPLSENDRLEGALKSYCLAYHPLTNKPLTNEEVKNLFHQSQPKKEGE